MILNAKLSTQSIQSMIRKLKDIQEMFSEDSKDSEHLIDILVTEAAEVAQQAYGNWQVQAIPVTEDATTGQIWVTGDMPAIAEFGAGDATVVPSTVFETTDLDFDVWAGSYSLFVGSGDYYRYGAWRMPYTNTWYTEVRPHLGLAQAKMFLMQHSAEIVRGVFSFD